MSLDIVDLFETNPITKLNGNYQSKFIEKVVTTKKLLCWILTPSKNSVWKLEQKRHLKSTNMELINLNSFN